MGNNRNGLTRDDVAKAAERCFKLYGVHRTSMTDVADALGVARQTLYRVFDSRTLLLEFISIKRITRLSQKLKVEFKKFGSLEEALIEGSLISLESRHNDPLLEEIFAHSDDHGFEQFVFQGSPEIVAQMLDIWSPFIERARESGQLRPGISNERAVEWIRNIHAVVTLRNDYSLEQQRSLFSDFLVPSLIMDDGRAS